MGAAFHHLYTICPVCFCKSFSRNSFPFIRQSHKGSLPERRHHYLSFSLKNKLSIVSVIKANVCRRNFVQNVLFTGLVVSCIIQCRPAEALLREEQELHLPKLLYEEKRKELVKTSTGLEYFDIVCGKGPLPSPGSLLLVRYTSRLQGLNGWKLDSSENHEDGGFVEPFIFKWDEENKKRFVPGFWEAVASMRAGGKRRAIVPVRIAYRSADDEPRPKSWDARRRLLSVLNTNRDKTIVFDIELLKIICDRNESGI